MQQHYPGWHLIGRPAATEDDLWPLVELHRLLRRVGVLRLCNQVLAPTKAASDDLQIVRLLCIEFAPYAFDAMLVEIIAALLAGRGPQHHQRLGAPAWPELGNNWSIDGRRITERDVQRAVHHVAATIQALDLLDATGPIWSAVPSTRTLLPGATLRTEVLAGDHVNR